MRSVLALGPSGPFPFDSCPRWFQSTPACRTLDLPTYLRELVDGGHAQGTARRIVQTMSGHGATHVLLMGGAGGRKGHVEVLWDLRVAGLKHDARAVLEEISMPIRTGHEPKPGTALDELRMRPEVVAVHLSPQAEQVHQIPQEQMPGWARALGLKMGSRLHARGVAFVALAAGPIGATISVAAGTMDEAGQNAARLAHTALQDMASPARARLVW